MRARDTRRRTRDRAPKPSAREHADAGILGLQRLIGNRSVASAVLARQNGDSPLGVLPGSPDARRAEERRREEEAREEYERHIRESGERPKEHEIRMASDPAYRKEWEVEAAQALEEALARMRALQAHAAGVLATNRARGWEAVWTRKEVVESLGGTLQPALVSEDEEKLRDKLAKAVRRRDALNAKIPKTERAKPEHAPALRDAAKLVADAAAALALREAEFAAHRTAGRRKIDAVIDAVTDARVTPQELSRRVNDFLDDVGRPINATKKLSELVTAKALWFADDARMQLGPGPKAVGQGVDSPDYVGGAGIIGDNLRIEGLRAQRGQLELHPDPAVHGGRMRGVKNAIVTGIGSKVTTYYEKHLKAGKRIVVTLDVTDCPWVLEHVQEIFAEVEKRKTVDRTSVVNYLHAVYFVVGGRAHRVWPRP